MYPSIFFSNNYQADFNDYFYIKEFNLNSLYSNIMSHTLKLTVPTSYFESELKVPSTVIYSEEDTYFEDNLAAPREDAFYRGINSFDNKYFYRLFDNDLATSTAKALIEYSIPSSYLQLSYYDRQGILCEVVIPFPFKEAIYNYYENNTLTLSPLSISFNYSKEQASINTLQEDYTIATETVVVDYNYAALNNLFNELIIEGLPATIILVQLHIAGTLQSVATTHSSQINYPIINYSNSLINLKELAFSLFNISTYRPDDYDSVLKAILNFLVYQTQENNYYLTPSSIDTVSINTLINTINQGVQFTPNTIYIIPDNFDRYSYYDNTLMTLSLLFNLERISGEVFSKYLESIVAKLISSLNLVSGYCNKEISTNYVPLIINDVSTTVLLALVLEKYLTIKYSSTYEYVLYLLNSKLEELTTSSEILDNYIADTTIDFEFNLLFHLSIWLKARDEVGVDFRTRLSNLISSTTPNSVDIDSVLQVNYLIQVLNLSVDTATVSAWDYSNFLTEYKEDLWGNTEPSLYYTTWVNLINNKTPIWGTSTYRLNYKEVDSFLATIFQQSLKYIPVNEPWFDPDKLNPNLGIIGLLMKATTSCYIPFAFEYLCYSKSLNIDNAYGVGLDKWGSFYGLPRQPKEDDNSYKYKLKQLTLINTINTLTIESFVDNLKQVSSTYLIKTLPTDINYNGETYTLVDIVDLYNKAVENDPPSVTLLTGEVYDLSKELGVIKIVSYETEDINQLFMTVYNLVDVPVILKTISSIELLYSSTVIYNI